MRCADYPWTPGDTKKSDGTTYGDTIVGNNYKIRIKCPADLAYSAYSEYFDLSLTSQPTYAPSPLPSPQPTPVRE